jgi:hypothetical protein
VIDGYENVGASSDTSEPSVSHETVIPADETPLKTLVADVFTFDTCRNGLTEPDDVKMTVESKLAGARWPPAESVSDAARA